MHLNRELKKGSLIDITDVPITSCEGMTLAECVEFISTGMLDKEIAACGGLRIKKIQ